VQLKTTNHSEGSLNNGIPMQRIAGFASVVALFLSFYFFATAKSKWQEWPITEERISREKDPEARSFLILARAEKTQEIEQEKIRSKWA
jgi:hypothetical protein